VEASDTTEGRGGGGRFCIESLLASAATPFAAGRVLTRQQQVPAHRGPLLVGAEPPSCCSQHSRVVAPPSATLLALAAKCCHTSPHSPQVRGKMTALVINDIDAGLGHFANTQITVNNQVGGRAAGPQRASGCIEPAWAGGGGGGGPRCPPFAACLRGYSASPEPSALFFLRTFTPLVHHPLQSPLTLVPRMQHPTPSRPPLRAAPLPLIHPPGGGGHADEHLRQPQAGLRSPGLARE
jgi:hypothetical protein